ncbi:FecR family protein [Chitinophaga nivalis]|uniref:FecR domain-containing protein n=1 Tax=Chitinophaga nivalis TaxID=2991709 RepID=A0ABT3ITJ3_9BACT|nr:FecR domain-containing protein [Chitinophaga nivalis]MCW3463104.1 FecR domain-containing protein [Chitinophaga nivalis]MCW3487206.1 FecR domain-containing protein [Chitinophaga nivalis]
MTPSFPDEALYTLLCKYLLDEADAEERAWVEAWQQDDAGNPVLLASLRKVLDTATDNQTVATADTDKSWQQLYDKMDGTPVVVPMTTKRNYTWLKVAAVLLIVLGAGVWFMTGKSPEQVYAGPVDARLKDGSEVQLSAAARLEIASGFNDHNRKVSFSGQATFNVAGSAENPFVIVLGHNKEVKVLGTRFMVDYEPTTTALKVHVSSGKVMVIDHDKGDSALLTEGMLLQQDKTRPAFRVASHVTDAVKKSLAFHDTQLEEVLHTITAVYDVKVEVADTALLKLTVNANFTGESIDDMISALAMTLNAQWEKTGDRQYQLK